MTDITSTRRTQIVKSDPLGTHKNTATDFSELSGGHITNTLGFIDNPLMLAFTDNSAGEIQLSSGYAFTKYLIDGRTGRARCEVVSDIAADISGEADGDYYLYFLLDSPTLIAGSSDVDGADVSTLVLSAALPGTGYYNPLFKINKNGSDITVVEDYRELRKINIADLEVGSIDISLADLTDVDDALAPVNDTILAYNGGTNQFETRLLSDVANIKKMTVLVELGEDMYAGDGYGAVFFGAGLTNTAPTVQLTGGTDIAMGNGTQIRLREQITVPSLASYANVLGSRLLRIKEGGTPGDEISIKVFESDGTTLIQDVGVIDSADLTAAYQTIETMLSPVDLSGYEGQVVYIEYSRTAGQSATNYYIFEGTGGGIVEYYDGSIRVADGTQFYHRTQRQFNYEVDKVWKHNGAYKGTNFCDGIITDSGVAGDIVQMTKAGDLRQSVVEHGVRYFAGGSAQANIYDSGSYYSSGDVYQEVVSYVMPKVGFIEDITFQLIGYSAGYQVRCQVKINGGVVGTTIVSGTGGWIRTGITVDQAVNAGDVVSFELMVFLGTAGMTAGLRTITIEKKDQAEPGTFGTEYSVVGHTPFMIGVGTETQAINLSINEQKSEFRSLNLVEGEGGSQLINVAGGGPAQSQTQNFIMPAKGRFEYRCYAYTINTGGTPPDSKIQVRINGVLKYSVDLANNQSATQEWRNIPVNEGDDIEIYTTAYQGIACVWYQFYNY